METILLYAVIPLVLFGLVLFIFRGKLRRFRLKIPLFEIEAELEQRVDQVKEQTPSLAAVDASPEDEALATTGPSHLIETAWQNLEATATAAASEPTHALDSAINKLLSAGIIDPTEAAALREMHSIYQVAMSRRARAAAKPSPFTALPSTDNAAVRAAAKYKALAGGLSNVIAGYGSFITSPQTLKGTGSSVGSPADDKRGKDS